jgi:hypothetical protein
MDSKNEAILRKVAEIADAKGTLYSVEPVTEVPMDVLLGVVAMKGDRALRAIANDKKIDELYDNIVYSVKALARLESDDIISPPKKKR